jgi:hypothetical protein
MAAVFIVPPPTEAAGGSMQNDKPNRNQQHPGRYLLLKPHPEFEYGHINTPHSVQCRPSQ